jgi:integrase/recombinase XerC
MTVQVQLASGDYRIDAGWGGAGEENVLLGHLACHLASRAFSPATIRAYAFDVVISPGSSLIRASA